MDLSPMGCRTGFYLLYLGKSSEEEIARAFMAALQKCCRLSGCLRQTQCSAAITATFHYSGPRSTPAMYCTVYRKSINRGTTRRGVRMGCPPSFCYKFNLLLLTLQPCPRIAQRDGTVKNQPFRARIRINAEIPPLPFELEYIAGPHMG